MSLNHETWSKEPAYWFVILTKFHNDQGRSNSQWAGLDFEARSDLPYLFTRIWEIMFLFFKFNMFLFKSSSLLWSNSKTTWKIVNGSGWVGIVLKWAGLKISCRYGPGNGLKNAF